MRSSQRRQRPSSRLTRSGREPLTFRRRLVPVWVSTLLLLALWVSPSWAFEPHKTFSDIGRITLEQAVRTAMTIVQGTVLEAQFGMLKGHCSPVTLDTYQVVVLDPNKRVRTIFIHAESGRAVRSD